MEFDKNGKVPAPFWMFCLELSKLTGINIHVIKSLKLVSELWGDRLINGTYKVLIKDIKKDLKDSDDNGSYYELGITLAQLKHDKLVNEAIEKIEDFIDEHFVQD
mgnify:CR=1 FL=1